MPYSRQSMSVLKDLSCFPKETFIGCTRGMKRAERGEPRESKHISRILKNVTAVSAALIGDSHAQAINNRLTNAEAAQLPGRPRR